MPINQKVYGAGARDCKIKKADGTNIDIEAVVEVTGESQQEQIDVRGDDTLKTTFVTSQFEDITIRANAISFDALQALTGNSISSSAQGEEIPLGTDSEQSPPYIEVRSLTVGKRADGTSTYIQKVWHKVQITSIRITSSDGSELSVEMTGRAYKTALDIAGGALSPERIATLRDATNLSA